MSAPAYIAWAADTSAATGPPTSVATSATLGTAKTLLQLKTGAAKIRIIEWGYVLDAAASAPLRMELVETGSVNATVTSLGSGVRLYNDSTGPASMTAAAGTASTGFNASAEGTITASRLLGYNVENGIYFKQQFPLGREPEIPANTIVRIRATPTASASILVMPYLIWEE